MAKRYRMAGNRYVEISAWDVDPNRRVQLSFFDKGDQNAARQYFVTINKDDVTEIFTQILQAFDEEK